MELAILIFLILTVIGIVGYRSDQKKRNTEIEKIIFFVEKYRLQLSKNLSKAVKFNDYGAVIRDNRSKVFHEFFSSTGISTKLVKPQDAIGIAMYRLAILEKEAMEKNRFDPTKIPDSADAFEHWVATALDRFGWTARVTQASADQGIDVIASKGSLKIGLQCKLYSFPVGNKAVQEAHAGMSYYGLNRAAVISNADFTSSAQQLAEATGVILLSPHDLPHLEQLHNMTPHRPR
jgi:restriction system protein